MSAGGQGLDDEFDESGSGDVPDVVGWLRDHPQEWEFATIEDYFEANPAARRTFDDVLRRVWSSRVERLRRRRRRRWVVVGGIAALAVGGVAAAALVRSGQPTHPEAGPLCRAEPRAGGDAYALAPGADPIDGCARVWATDWFDIGGGTVPALTACIGSNGAIEVFPGESDICDALGLAPADPALSPENELVVALQERLIMEIDLADCRPVADVLPAAQAIVEQSGLDGWSVVVGPGSEAAVCTKTAVDSSTRTVVLHEF